MDKEKTLKCLASLARVDYWDVNGCPFCGRAFDDGYGHKTPHHYPGCPVLEAREVLEAEGIFV